VRQGVHGVLEDGIVAVLVGDVVEHQVEGLGVGVEAGKYKKVSVAWNFNLLKVVKRFTKVK
jgi:hypothetical protein